MPCTELEVRLTHQVTGWLFSAGSVLAYQVQAGCIELVVRTSFAVNRGLMLVQG